MPVRARYREGMWSLTEGVVLGASYLAAGGCSPYRLNRFIARELRRVIRQEFEWRRIPQALKRAERRGLITMTPSRHGTTVRVRATEAGEQLLARRQVEGAVHTHPNRWDGKWRLLLFDVPEKRRRDRDVLRRTLQNLGFYQLQESAWVYPYDCDALIATMRAAYHFSHITVRMLVVSSLEDDTALRLHFGV